jgi:hypothetical protein
MTTGRFRSDGLLFLPPRRSLDHQNEVIERRSTEFEWRRRRATNRTVTVAAQSKIALRPACIRPTPLKVLDSPGLGVESTRGRRSLSGFYLGQALTQCILAYEPSAVNDTLTGDYKPLSDRRLALGVGERGLHSRPFAGTRGQLQRLTERELEYLHWLGLKVKKEEAR